MSPTTPGKARFYRILVVDDNTDSATSQKLLLELMGHEVEVAFNGADALEAVPHVKPELVLLDLGLPIINGYEVARRLRNAYNHKPASRRCERLWFSGNTKANDPRRGSTHTS